MTHKYKLTGLTCNGCVSTVKDKLSQVIDIQLVDVNEERNEATITMTQHVSTDALKAALASHPKYTISDKTVAVATPSVSTSFDEPQKSWFATYKPLLTVFAYITGVSFFVAWHDSTFNGMAFMRYFMAGFFLVFSFFKLLDLEGFANSYSSYDLLAKRWHVYGFIYPFIELVLGIAYLIDFQPFSTNIATVFVMSFSTIGVLQSVLNKRKIQCACLGVGFNLPMSTVTIIEDSLMIFMAIATLFMMY